LLLLLGDGGGSQETLDAGLEKTRFKKKTSPVFFWVFLGFLRDFLVFLVLFLNIFAQKREFLGFFQFQEYF
jgi:hypothetical protein